MGQMRAYRRSPIRAEHACTFTSRRDGAVRCPSALVYCNQDAHLSIHELLVVQVDIPFVAGHAALLLCDTISRILSRQLK